MIGTSSQIHSVWLAKYDLELCMWKTSPDSQLSLKMDDQPTQEPWSENWPRSGMTVGGTLYQRRTLAQDLLTVLVPLDVADGSGLDSSESEGKVEPARSAEQTDAGRYFHISPSTL